MKKNKLIAMLMIIVAFSTILSTTIGCEKTKTQEEFQLEYLKLLDRMGVISDIYRNDKLDEDSNPVFHKLKIADRVILYPEKIELYIYCYPRFYGNEEIATLQEIIDLYGNYDEEIYQRFLALYKWVCTADGSNFTLDYNLALAKSSKLYQEKYGKNFTDKEKFQQWTTKEKIEFENFIRQNPDFMPREQYEKELNSLGIK